MTSFPRDPFLASFIVAIFLGNSGCVSFYGHRDVSVSVLDAETSQAIPRAHVDVRYLCFAVANAPHPASAMTADDGTTSVRAANFDAQEWSASADGFLSEQRHLIGADKGVRSIEFKLYHAPPPSVVVVVPNGYRGPLMVDRRPTDQWVQGEPGQRMFTFHSYSRGYVGIDATPLLTRMNPFAVIAMFEDGSRIAEPSFEVGASAVALRDIGVSGTRTLFVVGTERDVGKIHPLVYDYKNGDPHNISMNHEKFNAMFEAARAEADAKGSRSRGIFQR